MPLTPVFPERCRLKAEPRSARTGSAWLFSARIACDGGLAAQVLRVDGLEAFSTDVLVRVQHADGAVESHLLKPAAPSVTLRGPGAEYGAATYLKLGVEHILFGLDHLLFVLGLLLIVRDRWMLLKTITAFTVAHSLTLAAATFDLVRLPAAPVEAAIALSILFLGPEIVRVWRGQTSFTIRHPWVVAFAFGLLHGFGFAGALAELGVPRPELPLALLMFNLGVELGQLVFVAAVLLLGRLLHGAAWARRPAFQRLPGYLVGAMGAYWTIGTVLAIVRGPV
jgi:hydrogenase/urease accessory protein HupE